MTQTGSYYTFDFLSGFMALPNLRKITAEVAVVSHFTRHEPLPPSNATDITFYAMDISTPAISNLLADGSPIKRLKLLVGADPEYFDDGKFVNVLFGTSQHFLEHLELLRMNHDNFDCISSDTPSLIKLQSFTQLKYVSVNYESFRLDDSKMMEQLPSSLHTLELHALNAQEGMPSQILEMLENKNKFPMWSKLAIHGWISEENRRGLDIACRNQGVDLCRL